jgi:16S rRNA pseudouridine516 synthase
LTVLELLMKSDTASHLLYSQGFGTRKACAALIARGALTVDGERISEPEQQLLVEGRSFCVDGVEWPYATKAYLCLHKPAGYECSAKPSHWPSVYELLPAPLRNRPVKGGQNGVQAVGRLDQDTTGLLLLSDDGQFIHTMNSPKHHVPKVYVVTCAQPISAAQIAQLIAGVTLRDEPAPVRASACVRVDDRVCELTLTEGKYHQVKRMIAATGNYVSALHRARIGAFALPDGLRAGGWLWLRDSDLALLRA